MTKKRPESTFLFLLALLTIACGPRLEEPGEDGGDPDPDLADQPCEEGSCPISCGDRTCAGALGIGRCVDNKCSPTPMDCVLESSSEKTCTEVCDSLGVICVENGCEGSTAFGYPGPEHLAVGYCGQSTPTVQEAVTRIEGSCDAPLVFTGEGSFELYQCCCDHPDY